MPVFRHCHAELGSGSASCSCALLNTFYLQINTEWNIPIWNFDKMSIAIFIHPYFLLRMICSLINVGAGGAAILGM